MNYTTAIIKLPIVAEATGELLTDPASVYKDCADMQNMAQESFQILTLNGKNKIINRHLVTLGLLNQTVCHAREVFRAAITDSASSIILLHNHPSGDPKPSEADKIMTDKLVKAGELLEIAVIDHMIIASEGYYSFLEGGELNN